MAVLARVAVIYPRATFPLAYARLYDHLENRGARIGTLDLLIATTAVLEAAPLVTSDRRHFERVPDLELIDHRT